MDIPDDQEQQAVLLARTKLMKAKLVLGDAPMGRAKLAAVREDVGRLVAIEDPLVWLQPGREQDCSHVANETLREMLHGVQLGLWTLCAQSLNRIEAEINERRPSCILEMGSGVSTLALQVFCRPLREAGHRVRIISVEQDERFANDTRSLLAKHGLEEGVELVVTSLRDRTADFGREVHSYDFSPLPGIMKGDKADFVLIDGPFGPPGSRVHVIPDLLHFDVLSRGAHFLMDDALRDGEMWVYDRWAERADIRLDGVYWVGKGFLSGNVIR